MDDREDRYRHRASPVGVLYHFPRDTLSNGDIRRVHGLPVTSPERTILDALEAGTQPDQIEKAVRQAIDRALTTPKRLLSAAGRRSATARATVSQLLR